MFISKNIILKILRYKTSTENKEWKGGSLNAFSRGRGRKLGTNLWIIAKSLVENYAATLSHRSWTFGTNDWIIDEQKEQRTICINCTTLPLTLYRVFLFYRKYSTPLSSIQFTEFCYWIGRILQKGVYIVYLVGNAFIIQLIQSRTKIRNKGQRSYCFTI